MGFSLEVTVSMPCRAASGTEVDFFNEVDLLLESRTDRNLFEGTAPAGSSVESVEPPGVVPQYVLFGFL